jgi:hypothetical protein
LYAQDSYRDFIRDLREVLGQTKAKKELEEQEIENQIRKLREEEKAVEPTLAAQIPRLPELLARKVCLHPPRVLRVTIYRSMKRYLIHPITSSSSRTRSARFTAAISTVSEKQSG